MNEIAAAGAALLLVEKLIPLIEEQVKAGQVPVAKQIELRARYEALRAKGDAAFGAAHWQVEAPVEQDAPQAPV
jgi:hypothetical protein